jgi:hypothetical protein
VTERKPKPTKAAKDSAPKLKKRAKDLDVPAEKGARVEAGKRTYVR